MKLTTTILFLLFIVSVTAQDAINQKDADGKKTGYWIITGKMSKYKGYPDSAIVEEGNYKTSRKTGVWKKFWTNENLKSEIEYKNGRPSGSYVTYYESGNIEEKGELNGGNLVNDYSSYYSSGCLKQFSYFGEDSTIQESYFDDCNIEKSIKGTIENSSRTDNKITGLVIYCGGGWNTKPEHTYCDTCTFSDQRE